MDSQNLPASGRSRGRGRASAPRNVGQDRRGLPPNVEPERQASGYARGQIAPRDLPLKTAADDNRQNVAAAVETKGAVVTEGSRGTVRGKRVLAEVVQTKPQNFTTKLGRMGTKAVVQANYFRIIKSPQWSIYQYRVDFSPEVDMIRLRRAYLAQHKELLGGYIFDGTLLFCTKYLMDQHPSGTMEVLTKNREGETIQIKIKHVGVVESCDSQQLQLLNLILRRSMEGLNLQLVGRNFFDPTAKINLDSYGIQIWPGYQTSIRQHERDILLCCEIAHKVMRTDSLHQILLQCLRDSEDYQSAFKREVIGMVVLTSYNNKTYRVDDVDFTRNPMSTFPTKEGEVRYIDYYRQRYNLVVRDQKQPLLISRPSEKSVRGGENELIMLIPELSLATGLTDDMRNNFRLMKAMSDYTRLMPDRRIERLQVFNKRLHESQVSSDVLKSWNMQLDKNLVEIPCRIIESQNIRFGGENKYKCDANADWTRECRKYAMFSIVNINRWNVIVPQRNVKEVNTFVQLCIKAARGMRMNIAEPSYNEMKDDRNASYCTAIDTATSKDPQIVMCVLLNMNAEKYGCIKKKCCIDRPIPSQVVTLRKIAPRDPAGLMSIATKVVIQMNAKLRGAPWMIEMPLGGVMTVGFDVCHSPKNKNSSYGAFVASMDIKVSTRYFSAVTPHSKGQELSNEISLNMTYALKAYREEHGKLPERILFYRDGVGDGQLHQVMDTEVKFLKQKLNEIYKSAGVATGCRLVFIIVSKRINTRYFMQKRNPPPGTVVDDIITLPERYDFFLVSQSVRQGTVSPTGYNIIDDNGGLDADKLQILTYKFTHLYYNWSGTCRVPAVCQYAHKLAFMVAEHIQRAPSNNLQNQLYFL